MPWLEKGNDHSSENLLFVHIPRCGGTSLMKSHKLAEKVTQTAPWYKKIFLSIFFSRYETFEKVNFPIWTELNAVCLLLFLAGTIWLQVIDHGMATALPNEVWYRMFAIAMIGGSSSIFVIFTYILNAPTISRIRWIRRGFLILCDYVLCQVMADTEYITGVTMDGYLPHLTARKILDGKYVSDKVFRDVSTFAIVRNPYARMVSVYMYNRFGPLESFPHFVKTWYHYTSKDYRDRGEMADWYIPNHAIPQFEYTHDHNGRHQLVQSVIKLEELKYLKSSSSNNNKKKRPRTRTARSSASNGIKHSTSSSNNSSNGNIAIPGGNNNIMKNNADTVSSNDDSGHGTDTTGDDSSSSSSSFLSLSSLEESVGKDMMILVEEEEQQQDATTIRDIPEAVHRALVAMPHDNSRKTSVPWYELYDQETLDLTYEMYHRDFDIFGYDIGLQQRPDLQPPSRISTRCTSTSTGSTKKQDAPYSSFSTSTSTVTPTTNSDRNSSPSSTTTEDDHDDDSWYPGYYASKLNSNNSSRSSSTTTSTSSSEDCWYPGYYASKIFLRKRNVVSQQQHYTSVLNSDDIKEYNFDKNGAP